MTHVGNDHRLPRICTRRDVLKSTLAVGTALLASSQTSQVWAAGISDRYAGLNSSRCLDEPVVETTISDETVFTEGPAVDRAGRVFFTNVPVSKILRWDPQTKQLAVYRENSNKANGLLFEPDGSLLACEGGAGRVTRTNPQTGKITVLIDEYNNRALGAPNDLARDRRGRIYFTSRLPNTAPEKGNVNSVYRIDPDGTVERILYAPNIHMPNGIVTSPDDKTLYLIEADGRKNRNRCIFAYDLTDDGRVENRRTLIDFYPGRSGDGMCIDAQGNLYVAAGLHARRGSSETLDTRPGIHVISPEGKLLAYARTPEDTITNCTFGGEDLRTLYVTCGTKLLSIRTHIPGKPDYRPEA